MRSSTTPVRSRSVELQLVADVRDEGLADGVATQDGGLLLGGELTAGTGNLLLSFRHGRTPSRVSSTAAGPSRSGRGSTPRSNPRRQGASPGAPSGALRGSPSGALVCAQTPL